MSLALAGGFLLCAAALAALGGGGSSASPGLVAALVGLHALASRVEFDVGPGSAVPTQLVLVPMLFLLPPAVVPLAVAAGYLLGGLVDHAKGRIHPQRAAVLISYSWHALGPALVLTLWPSPDPVLRDVPVYAVALAAQWSLDFAAAATRERAAFGVPPARLVPALLWVYAIDALLAPVGLLATLAAHQAGAGALLLAAPLVLLLGVLARDRRLRVERAVAFREAYEGASMAARTDALTGLRNRLAWEEAVAAAAADRDAGPVSVVVIDLDGLKLANDTLGHDCGDALLRAAATAVGSAVREHDVVARIGGDELAVLMRGTDEEACREVVARLADALHDHPPVAGLRLSAALGHATCPPAGDLDEARRAADERMYAAKRLARERS